MTPPLRTASYRLILTLGLVATLSGFLIVLIYQATLKAIAENKRVAIEQAVFQVVPSGATQRRTYKLRADGIHTKGDGITLFAAYNDKNELLGVATESAAQGYADLVRILYGYDPRCECITGFKVIKMVETPGLGDKISKDPTFLANFKALDARMDNTGNALANDIVTVKHGKKTQAWQIDAISGATISSRAVGKAVNDSAQRMIPQLQKYLTAIREIKD